MGIRVYLAGPDCFKPDSEELYSQRSAYLKEKGFEAVIPADGGMSKGVSPSISVAVDIYIQNIKKIKEADVVIANITPFRGSEPDAGTCFEIGFALALGKKVVCWEDLEASLKIEGEVPGLVVESTDGVCPNLSMYAEKVIGRGYAVPGFKDVNGSSIENMGLPVNLMIGVGAHELCSSFEAAVACL